MSGSAETPVDAPRRVRWERLGTDLIQVLPGQWHVTAEAELVGTVLGSCVAVTAHDPVARVGGLNHFLLPLSREEESCVSVPTRFGVQAMEVLLNALYAAGAERERLVLKAFGGADVLDCGARVGRRNVSFLRAFVRNEGLRLVAEDLEGEVARRVLFDPLCGRVRLKRIPMGAEDEVHRRDREHLERVSGSGAPEASVDLF